MVAVLAATFVCASLPCDAQLSATLDAGKASVHYDEYLRSSVVTVTPILRYDLSLSTLVARASWSRFESGSESLDLVAAASTFTRPLGIWRAELSAGGGGTVYAGIGTGHVSGSVRVHAMAERRGVWLGGGAGYVDDGVLGTSVARIGAGAWTRIGALTLNSGANYQTAAGLSATDLEVTLAWSRGPVDLLMNGGARFGGSDIIGVNRWGDLAGTVWLNRHVALVAAYGRYPVDISRATPGGSYTTVSVRLATKPQVAEVVYVPRLRFNAPTVSSPEIADFEVRTTAGLRRTIVVSAPGASSVEIAGDFTDWTPRVLAQDGGRDRFVLEMDIPAGSHRFNMRVNSGDWVVPPGVPVVRDEFDSAVALLVLTVR